MMIFYGRLEKIMGSSSSSSTDDNGTINSLIELQSKERRRRLNAFQKSSDIFPTNDGKYFFTHIRIGAKEGSQQLFTVLLLTDTSDIIIPCERCSDCDSSDNGITRKNFSKTIPGSSYSETNATNKHQREATGPELVDNICIGKTCSAQHQFQSILIVSGCTRFDPCIGLMK